MEDASDGDDEAPQPAEDSGKCIGQQAGETSQEQEEQPRKEDTESHKVRPPSGSSRSQGIEVSQPSVIMSRFLDMYAEMAQDCLDEREEPPANLEKCPACNRSLIAGDKPVETLYKCQDCPLSQPTCRECVLKDHRARPFDRIRRWWRDEEFWDKITLADLGKVLHLGHGGERCPTVPVRQDGTIHQVLTRQMVILHEHGLAETDVVFCRCSPRRSDPEQLIMAGLWPASWHAPRTATTIAALDAFHGLSVQAHVNIHDYVQHLKHMTDGVMTDDVKVRTRNAH